MLSGTQKAVLSKQGYKIIGIFKSCGGERARREGEGEDRERRRGGGGGGEEKREKGVHEKVITESY